MTEASAEGYSKWDNVCRRIFLNDGDGWLEKEEGKMEKKERRYVAIDLKSFYASVECVERGLDALTTNLVVADVSRTEKTICLAVSPSLKAWGIPGRARLFEVVERVREVNMERRLLAPGGAFAGSSSNALELQAHPELALDYLVAEPRMAYYMEYSTRIYQIYLNYIAPEDIHVYSIDEVFLDVTDYLEVHRMTPRELARTMIQDVLDHTGITATAGIGPNLYLCKVAMDIEAKHIAPDQNGVRIAELDEISYRQKLWSHRPLTDFWRVGRGYAKKLEEQGLYTMGDIARCSLGKETDYYNEELLYGMFGINAELLIDHAWGWEPCGMKEIKAYRPDSRSLGSGQVLHCPYSFEKARLVVREMADQLALDLVDKRLVTGQIVLTVGYDIENLRRPEGESRYQGKVSTDHYGRSVPKHAHGTVNFEQMTSSGKELVEAVTKLYDRIVDRKLLVRRIYVTANRVMEEGSLTRKETYEQLELFVDYGAESGQAENARQREQEALAREREHRMQQAMLDIKKKFGKNAILKGMNLQEGATARERNEQIGGHKA